MKTVSPTASMAWNALHIPNSPEHPAPPEEGVFIYAKDGALWSISPDGEPRTLIGAGRWTEGFDAHGNELVATIDETRRREPR